MIICKKRVDNIEDIYTDLTKTYLSSLSSVLSTEDLSRYNESTYLISEGYRNILCILFDLETETSTYFVKKYEEQLEIILRPICDKYNISKYTKEQRQGILEACIHCIEKSRKLVDNR